MFLPDVGRDNSVNVARNLRMICCILTFETLLICEQSLFGEFTEITMRLDAFSVAFVLLSSLSLFLASSCSLPVSSTAVTQAGNRLAACAEYLAGCCRAGGRPSPSR